MTPGCVLIHHRRFRAQPARHRRPPPHPRHRWIRRRHGVGSTDCELVADRKIHFVYGGRTERDICGEDMLKALPGFGTRIHYHPAISMVDNPASAGWNGHTGFVHDAAEKLFGDQLAHMEVYFAGPPPMAQAVMKMLIKAKVPAGQMHFDQFY